MTTITLTIPDELAEKAKERDLLSSSAIASYLEEKLADNSHSTQEAGGIDRWLAEMDEFRKTHKLSPGVSIVDIIREERDMS